MPTLPALPGPADQAAEVAVLGAVEALAVEAEEPDEPPLPPKHADRGTDALFGRLYLKWHQPLELSLTGLAGLVLTGLA